MKRFIALAAIASAVLVTACEDPRPAEPEVLEPPMEDAVAPAVEEVQAPAAATSATDTPPTDSPSPSEKRTSEESVRPDSETLFY